MSYSVLIVDDYDTLRQALARIIKGTNLDITVHTAGDIDGAIEVLSSVQIDLALVDHNLNDGKDSNAFCLEHLPLGNYLRITADTGHKLEQIREAGAEGFGVLDKGSQLREELLAILGDVLERSRDLIERSAMRPDLSSLPSHPPSSRSRGDERRGLNP